MTHSPKIMKFDDYMYVVKGPELKVKQPSIQKKAL